jgi:hypothetical protein
MPITSDLYLVAGYPSDEDAPYVKIAFNSDDLQSDYEWDWFVPTYSNGEVAIVEISLKDSDLERDAEYLVREAQSMQKEIDEGNLLLESCKSKKSKKSLKESDKPAATSIEDAQKWVDYDMKKYGRISGRTNRLVKKAGFQIIKDDHGDYEVTAGKFESVNEEVEKVDIETESDRVTMEQDENGKVVVTTEPKEATEVEDAGDIIIGQTPTVEKVPVVTPADTQINETSSGSSSGALVAALATAGAVGAGIGAKIYIDKRKENQNNGEDDDFSEEE